MRQSEYRRWLRKRAKQHKGWALPRNGEKQKLPKRKKTYQRAHLKKTKSGRIGRYKWSGLQLRKQKVKKDWVTELEAKKQRMDLDVLAKRLRIKTKSIPHCLYYRLPMDVRLAYGLVCRTDSTATV